jgi:hypothetical protein
MTKDDFVRMVREAGLAPICEACDEPDVRYAYENWDSELERFAKLVYEKAWADTALAATHTVTDAAIAKERESCAKVCDKLWSAAECAEAIRAALEQPEEEPVAWRYAMDVSVEGPRWIYSERDPAEWRDPDMANWAIEPLYAHPPRREWRGLTEEEIYPLYSEPSSDAEMVEFARAIEAALRSKNHD